MAGNDIFLDLKGVEGESKDSAHPKTIQLESFSFGCRLPRDEATLQPIGKRHHTPLLCVKHTDAATSRLLQALFTNRKIDKGQLIVRKAGPSQQEFLTVDLEDVYVSSFSVSAPSASLPMESFELVYGKITVTYKEQTALGILGGPITAQDDLRTTT
ncbi:MAG: Hcp family type VI secretion system effector [Acidobacteriota bacterium]